MTDDGPRHGRLQHLPGRQRRRGCRSWTSSGGSTRSSSTTAPRSPSCATCTACSSWTVGQRRRVTFWICRTCGVEHADRPAVCADLRRRTPVGPRGRPGVGDPRGAAAEGYAASLTALEPDLYAITSTPGAGIGQQSKLVCTPDGNVLWDPIGFLDDAVVDAIRALGPVVAIVASHPHMYGVQVEWSRRLGDAAGPRRRVRRALGGPPRPGRRHLVRRARDAARSHAQPARRPLPRQRGAALGGRRGRSRRAAHGRHGLRQPRPASVAFMRSFPNHMPLSGAVAERVAAHSRRLGVRPSLRQLRQRHRPRRAGRRPLARPTGTSPGSAATTTTSPDES